MLSIQSILNPITKKINNHSSANQLKSSKLEKLHSSDIAFLRIVHWYQTKANGKGCYLKRANWPSELQKFGGKAITYRPFKQKTAKLRRLGYVIAIRETHHGRYANRNKEYTWYITELGILAVDNFKKQPLQKIKNSPSELKKQPLGIEKTAPPLNHDELKIKHENLIKILPVNKNEILDRLHEIGFYKKTALRMLEDYSENQLYNAYCLTKNNMPKNPGGYMTQVLKNLYRKNGKVIDV